MAMASNTQATAAAAVRATLRFSGLCLGFLSVAGPLSAGFCSGSGSGIQMQPMGVRSRTLAEDTSKVCPKPCKDGTRKQMGPHAGPMRRTLAVVLVARVTAGKVGQRIGIEAA